MPSNGAVAVARPASPGCAAGYYTNFTKGFEGTFASIDEWQGGLDALVPRGARAPGDSTLELCRREHCGVPRGFGASDGEFTGDNYGVTTTPRLEWDFAYDPSAVPDGLMQAGVDAHSGASLGERRRVDWRDVQANLHALLNSSFEQAGFGYAVSEEAAAAIGLLDVEVIVLVLYTSPVRAPLAGLLAPRPPRLAHDCA